MARYSLTVHHNGETETLTAPAGCSFLEFLRVAGYSEIHAPCGGLGTCKQCNIIITGTVSPADDPNSPQEVKNKELLGCRWSPAGDCELVIPEEFKIEALIEGAGDIPPGDGGLGVAVDIGTTTVAAYLYDLGTGKMLAVESGRNAQRAFGADVISRIQYAGAGEDGLRTLQKTVVSQLDKAIDALCGKSGRQRAEIVRVSIAANTVMEHIFDGLSPAGIGVSPFTPESFFGDERCGDRFFGGLGDDAMIYMCPALAGYVGGDITAGLLHSGAWKADKPCLFIDIGTNGEMGLGDKNGFICCATAAGPAFEGAEIECGMDASPGAINKVWYEDEKIQYTTIGDAPARGICGSGLIDALAALLKCGAVEESGRMLPAMEAGGGIRENLRRDEAGQMRFYFSEDVYIGASDIRQLQLAKAAIRGGIETLISQAKKKHEEIKEVLIAGGFGAYMDVKSACAIGLLPPSLMKKTRHVGNCAGGGAALALNIRERERMERVTNKCKYIELSSSGLFMEKYIECMIFDEYQDVE